MAYPADRVNKKYKKPERKDYPDDITYEDDIGRYLWGYEPLGPQQPKRVLAPEEEAAITSIRAQEAPSGAPPPPSRWSSGSESSLSLQPSPDEQIFWQRNFTQITSRAVRTSYQVFDLQTVDRVEIINRYSRGRGQGTTYSIGGRRGGPRVHFSEGESRSRSFGDMVLFSQGRIVFTVHEVQDPVGIKRLIKASNPHIK
jgi:hypothetical protein